MARITVGDIEELATIKSQLCISIYIPTHKSGHEVNNGMDQISFKNELQNVKNKLEDKGMQGRDITQLLKPAEQFLDDTGHWHYMEHGLAAFISEGFFKVFKLPVAVQNQNFIAKEFIVTPMLQILNGNGKFYILNVSQEAVKLFRAERDEIEEVNLPENFITNLDEFLKYHEFRIDLHRRNSAAGSGNLGANFHGHSGDSDDVYKYIGHFFNDVDAKLNTLIKGEKAPLILAGVDSIQAIYRQENRYNLLLEEGISGNHDRTNKNDLLKKAWPIAEKYFMKPVKQQIEKYDQLAGTGKTSYEPTEVFQNALAGRVETFIFREDGHLWADINNKGDIVIHKEQQENDIDLFNSIAIQTLLNSGHVIPVPKEALPEKKAESDLVAVYRY